MGVELKPCPHCGMAVTLVDRDKLFVFRCPDESPCIGVGFATYGKRDQRETAITAWNTRATDTQLADLRRKLDVAREALGRIAEGDAGCLMLTKMPPTCSRAHVARTALATIGEQP